MTGAAESYAYHAERVAEGRPLAFVFHGTGGTENQFVPLMRELLPGAAIVAPRGDVSEHGALRFFRRRAEGLYDMADLEKRTVAMIGFLEAHVAIARPSRVVGLGYSNGANILASVIFRRPRLFEAAALMHPLIPWTPEPAPVMTATFPSRSPCIVRTLSREGWSLLFYRRCEGPKVPRQSRASRATALDCFAALAMTSAGWSRNPINRPG